MTIAYRIVLTLALRLIHTTATILGMASSFCSYTLTTGSRYERVHWVDGWPAPLVTQRVTVPSTTASAAAL
jgi:hypothetical protein